MAMTHRRHRVTIMFGAFAMLLAFVLTGTGFLLNQVLFDDARPDTIGAPAEYDRPVAYAQHRA